MKPRIVIDRDIPFLKEALEPVARVEARPADAIDTALLKDAQAFITRTRNRCDARLLEGTSVRFLGSATIGADHIDLAYCQAQGIEVATAPGCNAGAVMQYVFTALYGLWKGPQPFAAGQTLGIVGVGHVGQRVALFARALGYRVLLNDPPRERVEGPEAFTPLPDLLAQSDVVTLHVPLDPTTRALANHRFFEAMKPGAVFINASRGAVVDDADLLHAIEHLGPVVLDVWNHEPAVDPHVVAATAIATPHIAGYSLEGKRNATQDMVRALARFFDWKTMLDFAISLPEAPFVAPDLLLSRSFPIFVEDKKLREHPDGFERQRTAYCLRREWTSEQCRQIAFCLRK